MNISQLLMSIKKDRQMTGYDRIEMNQAISEALKKERDQRTTDRARSDAAYKCECRGHQDSIHDQRGWNAGYDSPVICRRCGRIEM